MPQRRCRHRSSNSSSSRRSLWWVRLHHSCSQGEPGAACLPGRLLALRPSRVLLRRAASVGSPQKAFRTLCLSQSTLAPSFLSKRSAWSLLLLALLRRLPTLRRLCPGAALLSTHLSNTSCHPASNQGTSISNFPSTTSSLLSCAVYETRHTHEWRTATRAGALAGSCGVRRNALFLLDVTASIIPAWNAAFPSRWSSNVWLRRP